MNLTRDRTEENTTATPEAEKEFVSEGEFHFERKSAHPIRKTTTKPEPISIAEKEPETEGETPALPGRRKNLAKWLIGFLLLVIVINAIIWVGYTNGVQSDYNLGFQEGNKAGYASGSSYGFADGYRQGNTTGYSMGYTQGLKDGAGTGYNIRDLTCQEMQNFLDSDKTSEHTYSENEYNCYDFTNDVCNNAFNAGIRCGSVYIEFPDGAHAIVCFKTIDQGLKFVEPQDDRIMTLTIGQKYFDRELYEVDFDDTIVAYSIIW